LSVEELPLHPASATMHTSTASLRLREAASFMWAPDAGLRDGPLQPDETGVPPTMRQDKQSNRTSPLTARDASAGPEVVDESLFQRAVALERQRGPVGSSLAEPAVQRGGVRLNGFDAAVRDKPTTRPHANSRRWCPSIEPDTRPQRLRDGRGKMTAKPQSGDVPAGRAWAALLGQEPPQRGGSWTPSKH
jgi:hypothetical protein